MISTILYHTVNVKSYKLLHFVLIVLLMFAPMRDVLASSPSHCEMAAMEMSDMDMHAAAPVVSEQVPQAVVINKSAGVHHKCCCCDGNNCAGNCDMGMAVSMLMQVSIYNPVFIRTNSFVVSSIDVLARALTPPSRPPLKLS
jgi:UDP-3-O-[3-hydroxymyristoyl] glucosamine N-acyltransferase